MAAGPGTQCIPLTVLQKQVLRILAANRSEESHFAGGLVLNAGEDSPRYSHDLDIFREAEAEVARASDLDVLSLRSAGYEVRQTGGDWKNPVSFRKAFMPFSGFFPVGSTRGEGSSEFWGSSSYGQMTLLGVFFR